MTIGQKKTLLKGGSLPFFGAFLVSFSLELFLVENYIIDGGTVGISIIISYFTNYDVGFILFLVNMPFLLIGFHYIGKKFLLLSLFSLSALAIGMFILEPLPAVTNNLLLVIVLGGVFLGIGVGIIIRFGGALDGTEVLAILLSKKSNYTIGQYVMLFNIFIFGSAVFVFGIKEALASLATFYVAYKTIDFSISL